VRIGIVTPAFNVAPTIAETIRSVLGQTHQDWTMAVVDDGSTDGTAAVIQGFRDPRLQLIRQPNAGVSAARNRGVAALDCDAALFLDGDDWLAPFALEALGRALAGAPEAVAAVGAYERGGRVQRPASGDLLERLLVRNLFVNGGHVLIRRQAVQPFREDLRYGEDWEFWVRLALWREPLRPLAPVMTRASRMDIPMAAGPEKMLPLPPTLVRFATQARKGRGSIFSIVPMCESCAPRGGGEKGRHAAFTRTRETRPILFVRERPSGAYLSMATNAASHAPCLDAIHGNRGLATCFSPERRVILRRQAEAEVHWIIGRELIRHGHHRDGLRWLRRSVAANPTPRRAALLAVAAWVPALPAAWRGPLRPYTDPPKG
jgi:glycosyltransferase involved in cell wall biosynthesis